MTNPKQERDGRCLVDDWTFSGETAFRISQLLDTFRHEFGRSRPKMLSRLASSRKNRLVLDFVRRVFTTLDQDDAISELLRSESDSVKDRKVLSLCYQFTGSSVFEAFRKNHDTARLDAAFNTAQAFCRTVKPGEELHEQWQHLTEFYRDANKNTTLIGVLKHLEEWIARLQTPTDLTIEKKVRFLSLLFVFYTRMSILGETSRTLSDEHFSFTSECTDFDFNAGCPGAFGYLLESNESGYDFNLLRIHSDGSVSPSLIAKTKRSDPIFFPDAHASINQEARGVGLRSVFGTLYGIFNGERPNRRHPQNVFDLVVPVYEIDDLSRDHAHFPREKRPPHIVSGPFLGWLYIRLDNAALRALLNSESKKSWMPCWEKLCKNGGHLAKGVESEIQQIRFALNRFSELYLLGEMEWAMEQDWGDAENAASFTKQHYHHCDGWKDLTDCQLKFDARALLAGGYCVFCRLNSKTKRLEAADDRTPAESITHFLVDAGRHFVIDEDLSEPSILILLEKRLDTAIPQGSQNRAHYREWLAMNIRQFYETARLREAERTAGRAKEKAAHFVATSHELKDLARLIPRAASKPFMLHSLKDALLTFSLPAASKLDYEKDSAHLPPAVYGHFTKSSDQTAEEPCENYQQWLAELVTLSASMQAIAMAGGKKVLAQSAAQLNAWTQEIGGHFRISSALGNKCLPQAFEAKCLLGVAIICAIRNSIKHCFSPSLLLDRNDSPCGVEWNYKWNDSMIEINCGTKWHYAKADFQPLQIQNRCDPDKTITQGGDGTKGAVEFYLEELQRVCYPKTTLLYEGYSDGRSFICQLPLINHKPSI